MERGDYMVGRKGLPQEALKMIACVTMLIDHIGAVFVPGYGLRIIGRIAFPIYCFLLAEGMARTRNVKRYGIRLAIGAALSELPYELLFYGSVSLGYQSVMVTLLIGYLMILWMRKTVMMKFIPVIVCVFAAELLGTDYGGMGVAMIALFALTRERPDRLWLQVFTCAALCWIIGGAGWQVGPVYVPLQIFGVLAMVPIALYSGGKATNSKAIQWVFYLFYPVHLAVLLVIAWLI